MKQKQVITLISTLEEKKRQQRLLDHVKDKPLFRDKIEAIKESLKGVEGITPISE